MDYRKREISAEIQILRTEFPVLAILGPRQSGKTTLAQHLFADWRYVSFEDVDMREFATTDPRRFLSTYSKQVIFDEIQRVPDLISYLQTHVDMVGEVGQFVLTGSHNFLLMEQISQSLAGRVGIVTLLPFSNHELGDLIGDVDTRIFQGGYPRIYDQDIRPEMFYSNYVATYLEKDVRQIRSVNDLEAFQRFLKIMAGRTGQELNLSAVADACGLSPNTVRDWVSILEASYIIHRLSPYYANYNKRLVKSTKVYFCDTGLACHLMGIRSPDELVLHFARGNLFETMVVNEFLKYGFNHGRPYNLYFWRDNNRNEIDLILEAGTRKTAIEIKSAATMQDAQFKGLKYWQKISGAAPEDCWLVYGGDQTQQRSAGQVVPWNMVWGALER